jgi:hypothetical protein
MLEFFSYCRCWWNRAIVDTQHTEVNERLVEAGILHRKNCAIRKDDISE